MSMLTLLFTVTLSLFHLYLVSGNDRRERERERERERRTHARKHNLSRARPRSLSSSLSPCLSSLSLTSLFSPSLPLSLAVRLAVAAGLTTNEHIKGTHYPGQDSSCIRHWSAGNDNDNE
jgi:hypothetical protein